MAYVREIQLANTLGYTEVEDFRRAIASGTVLEPDQYLGPKKRRPIWSQVRIDEWLGASSEEKMDAEIWDRIRQVA